MESWSNSKLADLIRGIKKPFSGTLEDWDNWREKAIKEKGKLRFFLAEDLLDFIQDLIFYPSSILRKIFYHLNNRFATKTHTLTANKTTIKRGDWIDLGNRFLPTMFDSLVDFVEIECAWINIKWGKEDFEKYNVPWWKKIGLYRNWRSKESGVDYLNWSASLVYDESTGLAPNSPDYQKSTEQALAAREILALYDWWTKVRPNRKDPYLISDYEEIRNILAQKYGTFGMFTSKETADERALLNKSLDEIIDLEKIYEEEDEEMMIRLIKIRNHLWT